MKQQKTRDTKPELELRSALHRRGLRFRVGHPVIGTRRKADVVFAGARVAVFVDGCFWHMCPVHGTTPKANADFWQAKLAGNQERDRHTDESLREAGWLPVRVWEHESMEEAAERVALLVRGRLPGS
ncbi:very short patch repair protein [Myxococcus stipitatus DSM 14675]|uniref:Very short patch repair protein n=2 Tax=Myxococcus stipitatus TaxID=83455 RepID=L7UH64_MYXSD|nr:very short patch repair protein [Myxococcus stipitatus DSM 14675]